MYPAMFCYYYISFYFIVFISLTDFSAEKKKKHNHEKSPLLDNKHEHDHIVDKSGLETAKVKPYQ